MPGPLPSGLPCAMGLQTLWISDMAAAGCWSPGPDLFLLFKRLDCLLVLTASHAGEAQKRASCKATQEDGIK